MCLIRLGSQWSEDICYREPLKEITRLPPKPALPPLAALGDVISRPLALPKKLQDDPMRRDSGMSTGSSEMESSDVPDTETIPAGTSSSTHDMAGWWEPRVKANLADQLPGNYIFIFKCLKFINFNFFQIRKFVLECTTRSLRFPRS